MTPCPHCHDSLGHRDLSECPETGRALPANDGAGPGGPEPVVCPHCSTTGGHAGLEYCPETGGRMPHRESRSAVAAPPDAAAAASKGPNDPSEPESEPRSEPSAGSARPSRDPHAQLMKSWLLEVVGHAPIGLDEGEAIVLGRNGESPFGASCGDSISRNHVELRVRDDVLFAQDLGSTNGTFLNGQRLVQRVPTPCADGDLVQLATEEPIRVEVRR